MPNDIREICITTLEKFITDQSTITNIKNGASILESATIDSLSLVNLIVELENSLGFSFESDDFEGIFSSLDKLVCYIDSQLS
jgi:acyl carrier protein